jgi:hypothetical protein
MRRSLTVSLVALGALLVLQTGATQAAPTNGKKTASFDVVCGGETVAVVSNGNNANSSWTVDTSGTSPTPAHIKELSVRVYSGALTTEPTSTDPIFASEKSFGERVGQGETTHCSGSDIDESCPCGPTTLFFDVEVTNVNI